MQPITSISRASIQSAVRAWDIAATTKSSSDYTVGAKVGWREDGLLVVLDIVRGRWEWPDAVKVITDTIRGDGPSVRQGVEAVGTQVGIFQTLMRDPMLVSFAIEPIQVHQDKMTRALPLIARAEHKKVVFVSGNWNQACFDELCSFPSGEHDDQVDCLATALTMISTPTGAFSSDSIRTATLGKTDYQVEAGRLELGQL